ncbi:precorrin-6A reductase [Candidatus Magnetominusculus dajiuhuensis]|uniref:precorrin-6A reductase n=1 Tax=Candidatus Magnetominusculus dajiuhuensis TaxID=3137712 RepID=UPI003B4298C7
MDIAVFCITPNGTALAEKIAAGTSGDLHVKAGVLTEAGGSAKVHTFDSLSAHTASVFNRYGGLVFVMSLGIVNRVIAPLLRNKLEDPAVVTLDEAGRFAVSTLSGHEGGANALTYLISSITGAQPVVTTATDSLRIYTCGVGCVKGAKKEAITAAITEGCKKAGITTDNLRCLASAWVKRDEQGLLAAAAALHLYVRFIPKWMIDMYYERNTAAVKSDMVFKSIGVYGVAEPSAALSGSSSRLVLPKTIFDGITVAIARETLFPGPQEPKIDVSQGSGRILVLGGTTEGVNMGYELMKGGEDFLVSTVTGYGFNLFKEKFGDRAILENFTTADALKRFIKKHAITKIIDCTHPYAELITPLAKSVSTELKLVYESKVRDTAFDNEFQYEKLCYVSSLTQVIDKILALKVKRPLFTTGSKELGFVRPLSENGGVDIFVRVLPFEHSIKSALEAGVNAANIIAMQGPFTTELNAATIRQYAIDCLVTKKTGKEGGFYEKVNAAVDCGVHLIVVER